MSLVPMLGDPFTIAVDCQESAGSHECLKPPPYAFGESETVECLYSLDGGAAISVIPDIGEATRMVLGTTVSLNDTARQPDYVSVQVFANITCTPWSPACNMEIVRGCMPLESAVAHFRLFCNFPADGSENTTREDDNHSPYPWTASAVFDTLPDPHAISVVCAGIMQSDTDQPNLDVFPWGPDAGIRAVELVEGSISANEVDGGGPTVDGGFGGPGFVANVRGFYVVEDPVGATTLGAVGRGVVRRARVS